MMKAKTKGKNVMQQVIIILASVAVVGSKPKIPSNQINGTIFLVVVIIVAPF